MEFTFTLAKEIDPVALLALVLALVHGSISLFRWIFCRTKAKFIVRPNIQFFGQGFENSKTYISFEVRNIGDKPFVLRGVYAEVWTSRWKKILRSKPKSLYINVADYMGKDNIPADIPVGAIWNGFAFQTPEVLAFMAGYISFQATYSLSDKPLKFVINGYVAPEPKGAN